MVALATALYDDFRHNVAEQMRRRSMTHAELAERLQVSRPYVSQLLAGTVSTKRGVSLDIVEKVAKIFGVKPATLLRQPTESPAIAE